MPFTEDLDSFLLESDFATEVVVDGNTVYAIFEKQYQQVSLGKADYSGEYPTLLGKASDFADKNNTTVTIGTDSYKIIDVKPDGTGLATAVLIEQ